MIPLLKNPVSLKTCLSRSAVLRSAAIIVCLLLVACGSSNPAPGVRSNAPQVAAVDMSIIEELLERADLDSTGETIPLLLSAMETMLADGHTERAVMMVNSISDPENLELDQKLRYAMILGRIALIQYQAQLATSIFSGNLVTDAGNSTPELKLELTSLRSQAYLKNHQYQESVAELTRLKRLQDDLGAAAIYDEIWANLASLSTVDLNQLSSNATSYETRGWIELAKLVNTEHYSITNQLAAISRWREVWTQHPGMSLLPTPLRSLETMRRDRPEHIALLLPIQEQIGRAIQQGFFSAYYQELETDSALPRVSIYDTGGSDNVVPIYNEAISRGAELVIGPLDKDLVKQLQELRELAVPTLALNYGDNNSDNPTQLYQFGLAPEDEISQIANLAWGKGYRNAAIVTPDSENYLELQTEFDELWQQMGGRIVSRATFTGNNDYSDVIKRLMAIDSSEKRARELRDLLPRNSIEFIPRPRQDIDFILLMANPTQGRQIKPTLTFHFAGDIPVYALPSINDGLENPAENQDLNGVLFTDAPWVLSSNDPLKKELNDNLSETQGLLQRLRAMGIDSYRLYPRLQQMTSGELRSLQGSTGILTVNPGGQIKRELTGARFDNGIARIIE